jgi:hypothetical protein
MSSEFVQFMERARHRVYAIHDRRWQTFCRDYPREARWIKANPHLAFSAAMYAAVQQWERLTPKQYAALKRCAEGKSVDPEDVES